MRTGSEILVPLAIILLIFGYKKLPEMARSIGVSAKELRKAASDDADETTDDPASASPDANESGA